LRKPSDKPIERVKLLAPLLVLLVAIGVRALTLGAPLYEAHHIRQCDTATMARNMVRHGLDPFHPRLDWTGPEAPPVESEFPVYALAVAASWRVLPSPSVPVARAMTLLGMAVLIWAIGAVAARLGDGRDRAPAMLLVGFVPLTLVFGRAVIPDIWALALGWAGLAALTRTCGGDGEGARDTRWLLIGAGLLALSAMAKLPMLVLWPPAMLLVWRAGANRRPLRIGALLAATLPVAIWSAHAASLGNASGFSLGVGFESGKWTTPAVLLDPLTWRAYAGVLGSEAVLVIGLLTVGWAGARSLGDRSLDPAWLGLASFGVLALVAAPAVRAHDYYFLPLVCWASLAAGRGLRHAMGRRSGRVLVVVALLLSAWSGALATRRLLRQDEVPRHQGHALAEAVERDRTVLVCDPFVPSILWAADRRGFKTLSFEAGDLEGYRARGVTDLWLTTACNGGLEPALLEVLRRDHDVTASGEWAWHVELRGTAPGGEG
jgi:hypothetical protein